MHEREIIQELHGLFATGKNGLLRGIGDDCAVIEKDNRLAWLVTMDTLIEGVHFDLRWHPPEKLGRKAVSVNVSDVAAMGGRPLYLFLSLGLPADFKPSWLRALTRGIREACDEYGCALAGGDTVRSPAGVQITITAVGEMETDRVVYRNGARAGDIIWVSGTLGNAAAGLELCRQRGDVSAELTALVEAHLDPRPRMELAHRLARRQAATAMMDLSDGLATDLSHICRLSGKGAIVRGADLPISSSLEAAGRLLGRDPLSWMISGGEDYELLFTTAPDRKEEIVELAGETGVQLTPIGTIVRENGVRLVLADPASGREECRDIGYMGFDHFPGEENPKTDRRK